MTTFPFDPTYGHSPEALYHVTLEDAEPSDFVSFWEGSFEASRGIALEAEWEENLPMGNGLILERVSYQVLGGYRAGAWVIRPETLTGKERVWVCGHGYGGREAPDPNLAGEGRVVIFPVAPGFHISADQRLPLNDAGRHVVFGIEHPETYLLRSCAATLWRSVDVLEQRLNRLLDQVHYHGWSFGGGMGALMLPWEKRFTSAELGQVTFAHHPFRLRHECQGSGAAVRARWLEEPSIERTLRYYEACFSLRNLSIPVVFACALFDPAVPPPGQWAAANAHAGPSRISSFPTGHCPDPHPDDDRAMARHLKKLEEMFPSNSRA